MKKYYIHPTTEVFLCLPSKMIAASVSPDGQEVTFDNFKTEQDAGEAASRGFSLWDDENLD